jgi:hypothetical protein
MSKLSRNCGNLNISHPYGPPRPVTGIPLLFSLLFYTLLVGLQLTNHRHDLSQTLKNSTHMTRTTWVNVLLLRFTSINTTTVQMQFQLPRVTYIWGTSRGQPNRNAVEKSQPWATAFRMTATPTEGFFLNHSHLKSYDRRGLGGASVETFPYKLWNMSRLEHYGMCFYR